MVRSALRCGFIKEKFFLARKKSNYSKIQNINRTIRLIKNFLNMLFQKKVKYRKWQKDRTNPLKIRKETRGITLAFGSLGLRAVSGGRIKSNQIEAARKTITRAVSK